MSATDQQVIEFGPFRLDRRRRGLTREGASVSVGGRAFDILVALAAAAGETVGKAALLDQVWSGQSVEENNLQVHISALRKALGDGWIITVPGRGYRLLVSPRLVGPPTKSDGFDGKPSIAVLAFENMNGDTDQEYFSDGVAEEIITALSRTRSFFVIARNSTFMYKGREVDVRHLGREFGVRYVLQGSVRREGDRVRITARLLDAETGGHIWAERFDRGLAEAFVVQDEITVAVTRAIGPAVADAELRRVLRKPPKHLGAWEAYQQGLWHLSRKTRDDIAQARAFFNRALELDPTLASAHTGLAALFTTEGVFLTSRPLGEALTLAAVEAREALALDPTDADAHAFRAFASGHTGDYAEGFDHVEHALSINPSSAPAYHAKGWLLIMSGRPAEVREAIRLASRLDPRGALDVGGRSLIATAFYFERDYEKAVAANRRLLADRSEHPLAWRWLAAALGQLDRSDEARDALATMITVAPETIELYIRHRVPWMRPCDYDHMMEGLRKAGWQG